MPVKPGSFLSLTTLSETLGYSLLLIRMIFTVSRRTKENRKLRRCLNRQHFRKKNPKEIGIPPRNGEGRIFWSFCRRESVFPADDLSVTRRDGSNFPFGKTRRIRVSTTIVGILRRDCALELLLIIFPHEDCSFVIRIPR